MLKAKLCDLYQVEVWRDRGRGEGGEKTTVWRSGAVPRPGSKIPRASESGRLGPLYRLTHSCPSVLASGGAGPGDWRAAKAAMDGRAHPWIHSDSQ